MATLTSANSELAIIVYGLFPAPVPIAGYAADDAFIVEDVETAEMYMGVDGVLSAGYTPYKIPFELTLQADSASNDFFDAWIMAEKTAREKYIADASIIIQGTNKAYALTRGFLGKVSIMPPGKKVLQPRKFTIEFNHSDVAPA